MAVVLDSRQLKSVRYDKRARKRFEYTPRSS